MANFVNSDTDLSFSSCLPASATGSRPRAGMPRSLRFFRMACGSWTGPRDSGDKESLVVTAGVVAPSRAAPPAVAAANRALPLAARPPKGV